MDGNFYLGVKTVKVDGTSKLGKAYSQCRKESQVYAKCITDMQAVNAVVKDCCIDERHQLGLCVDHARKEGWSEGSRSLSRKK